MQRKQVSLLGLSDLPSHLEDILLQQAVRAAGPRWEEQEERAET